MNKNIKKIYDTFTKVSSELPYYLLIISSMFGFYALTGEFTVSIAIPIVLMILDQPKGSFKDL